MPMLLDQRSTSASGARPIEMLVVDLARPLISSTPLPVSTESASPTRPRSSSPAAMNGFDRRSGLERLGERRRRRLPRIEPAARHRQHVAAVRIEDDDVAALRAHLRDRVGQRLLGDLLRSALIVSTTLLPLVGAVLGRDRRLAALPFRILV